MYKNDNLKKFREFVPSTKTELYPNPTLSSQQIPGFEIEDFTRYMDRGDIDPLSQGMAGLIEQRAQNQSWADKWANAAVKMGITAGTTFLDGTVGTLAGLINMAIEGEGSAFWNNGVSKTLSAFQNETMEDWFPNYYTKAELERPWYENLITANFWADKVLKNMGFMIGTVASSALYGGMVRGLAGAKNIANSVGKGLVGRTLANGTILTNTDDAVNAFLRGQINMTDDVLKTIAADAKNLIRIDKASQMVGATMGSVGEARIEALQTVKEYGEQLKRDNPDIPDEVIKKTLSDMGNMVFLANMAVLSIGNYQQFKRAIGGGYKLEKLNYNGLLKGKAYTDGFATILEDKGKMTLRNALVTGKAIANPMWEGMEEQLQKISAEASELYYGQKYSDENQEKVATYIEAFANKFGEQLESIDNWEDFFIGFISGGIGSPNVLNMKNKAWAGGIWDAYFDEKNLRKDVKERVEFARKAGERIKNVYGLTLSQINEEGKKGEALRNDDRFEWETANANQIILDVANALELGKYDEYIEAVEANTNLSADEIKSIFERQTEEKTENRYDNKNSAEIKQEINNRIKQIKQIAEFTRDNRDFLKVKFPKADDKTINELLYYMVSEKNTSDRIEQVVGKISELSKVLDGRDVQEVAKRVAQFEGRTNYLNAYKERVSNIQKVIQKLQDSFSVGEIKDIKENITKLKEAIQTSKLFDSIEGLEGHIDSILSDIDNMSSDISKLGVKTVELKQKADFSPITTDKNQILQANRKAARRILDRIENMFKSIQNLNKQKNLLQQEYNELNEQLNKRLEITDPKDTDVQELKQNKERLKEIENSIKEINRLENILSRYNKIVQDTQDNLDNLNKEEAALREIVKEIPEFKDLTGEEKIEKINEFLIKNNEVRKKLAELYEYKPELKAQLDPYVKDLMKLEARKKGLLNALGRAFKSNGVEELENSIKKYDEDMAERSNRSKFNAKFKDGDSIIDTEEGKEYKLLNLDGSLALYDKNENGEWTKKLRNFTYTKGALDRYKLKDEIQQPSQVAQAAPTTQPTQSIVVEKTPAYKVENEPYSSDVWFDIDPKRTQGNVLNGTTGNIGEVQDKVKIVIPIKQSEDATNFEAVRRFQLFVERHKFSKKDYSGKVATGEQVYGKNWENEKKRLKGLGFNPDAVKYLIVVDKNGNEQKDKAGNLIFTTLPESSVFTPMVIEGKLAEKSINNSEIKKGTLVLVRSENGTFTADKYNSIHGTKYTITYPADAFPKEVTVIKAKFAINNGVLKQTELVNEEKTYKTFLNSLKDGDIIPFTGKTKGVTILTEQTYEVNDYIKHFNLKEDEYDFIVATENYYSEFGVDFPTRKGYTYMVDKRNERLVQLVPRKLNTNEQQTAIDALKLYISQLKLNKDKINNKDAATVMFNGVPINLFETLRHLMGFASPYNISDSNTNTRKNVAALHTELRNLRKQGKTAEFNKKLEDLNKILSQLSTSSRLVYLQSEFYDADYIPGGYIVIGFKDGKPNKYPLLDQDQIKKGNIVLDKGAEGALMELLKDKYFNIVSQQLKNNDKEFNIITKIENNTVKEVDNINNYKQFLSGNSKAKTQPVLNSREQYKPEEINAIDTDGNKINKEMPTAANRYLKFEIAPKMPNPENPNTPNETPTSKKQTDEKNMKEEEKNNALDAFFGTKPEEGIENKKQPEAKSTIETTTEEVVPMVNEVQSIDDYFKIEKNEAKEMDENIIANELNKFSLGDGEYDFNKMYELEKEYIKEKFNILSAEEFSNKMNELLDNGDSKFDAIIYNIIKKC